MGSPENTSKQDRLKNTARSMLLAASVAFVSACSENTDQIPTATVAEIVANPSSYLDKQGKIKAQLEKEGERTLLVPVIWPQMNGIPMHTNWIGKKTTTFLMRDVGASGPLTPKMKAFVTESSYNQLVPMLHHYPEGSHSFEIIGKVAHVKNQEGTQEFVFEIGTLKESK